jgi:arylsulfatase A-like enzyme
VFSRSNASAAEKAERPNVLIVMPDQMRGMALGCRENPDVKTPNLDRLASQGLLLRRMFANTPVCCPARANILTGTYAHKNGMVANDLRLRESKTTLAEILEEQGYRTGYVGKWHLDGGPRLPGFIPPGPRRQGFQFWAANECSHQHFKPTYFRDTETPITEDRFEPEVWTDRAIEFLQQKDDAPFFLMVSMGPPHDPYGAPEGYEALYDPAKLTMRPNWVTGTTNSGREQIARYYAAITAIDDQVGRLLKALDDSGQADNTIVFFLSDHGDMLGSHGKYLKRKPWEESIRVPGIVRYPAKLKPGRISDVLFTHVDMAPSLLTLCGVPVPGEMQGTDLSGVLLGKDETGPESAYFQIFVPFAGDESPLPWRGVRTANAMYARTEKSPWLLYDLDADPYEQTNLIDDPAHAALRDQMDAQVLSWMKRVGDSWANDSMATVEDKGRLYRFGTFYTIQEYLDWAKEHPELAPKD